ncbi:MAG: competence/damage-inducible protein A, partial [Lachnospiraceae bacterium]|nr:competence/damage-inducible protein A [Lachnospiraceae bacterium]
MVAEIISIGTEILLGNIVNTNASFLAQKCADLGVLCYYQQVVGDNADRLKDALKLALSRSELILMSGGLGPTEDDIS